jgi:hypothetical protein
MKILIPIVLILLFALVAFKRQDTSPDIPTVSGSFEILEGHLSKLMNDNDDYSFLIVTVSDTNDFIQFTGDNKGVQLDFPLSTERQRSLEAQFRKSAGEQNLKIIENKGSDGTMFMDIDINGSPSFIANVSEKLMRSVFSIKDGSIIEYQYSK